MDSITVLHVRAFLMSRVLIELIIDQSLKNLPDEEVLLLVVRLLPFWVMCSV